MAEEAPTQVETGQAALDRLKLFLRPGDDTTVDETLLREQLRRLESSWTDERLTRLFKLMDTNEDGMVQYDELVYWAIGNSERNAKWEIKHYPVGEEPHIGVKCQLADGEQAEAKKLNAPEVFIIGVSKNSSISELADVISLCLGLPSGCIAFTYEGSGLDFDLTLEGNKIHLPGPARRRKGDMVNLQFAFSGDLKSSNMKTSAQALLLHLQREDWMKGEDERRRIAEEKRKIEQEELRSRQLAEELAKREGADKELDDYVSDHIGVTAELREQLSRSFDLTEQRKEKKLVPFENHFLIEEGEDVRTALESMQGLGTVVKVYRVENEDLKRRYLRAKENLQKGGGINHYDTQLAKKCKGNAPVDFMGPYDSIINELPLWHGTPSAEAAGGICSTGFDTNRVTTHVWGHGFYFADNSSTSAGYSRGGFTVNSKHSSLKVMLLCRALMGRVKTMSSAPNQDQQERLVADCLGPGGCFGSASTFHSIHGGGYAFVCAHRDQVYPAYVILYK